MKKYCLYGTNAMEKTKEFLALIKDYVLCKRYDQE